MNELLSEDMIMEITLEGKQSAKAEKLVNILFKNITDKAGESYLNHLYRVAQNFQDELRYTVSLLHDTIEDTAITMNDLAVLGFREEYLNVLDYLTRKEGQTYQEYIENILSSNNLAVLDIKLADLNDNSNPERLAKLSVEEQIRLTKKYQNAKELVKGKRNELW